jgi:hypothetical protein
MKGERINMAGKGKGIWKGKRELWQGRGDREGKKRNLGGK